MIAVIADDFSGAAELAGVAHRLGLAAEVQTQLAPTDADVVVLDTATRCLSASAAAERVGAVAAQLARARAQWVYKKIDSVLRGPVLAEVEAARLALGLRGALLVPANPQRNRCVVDGHVLIDGIPLHHTPFRDDPEHPARSSCVLQLLGSNPRTAVVSPQASSSGAGIMVGNAQRRDDLEVYAQQLSWDVLPAGGVEFFTTLLQRRGPVLAPATAADAVADERQQLRTGAPVEPPASRTLLVAGSVAGWEERAELCERYGIPVIELVDGSGVDCCRKRDMTEVVRLVRDALQQADVAMVAVGRTPCRDAAPGSCATSLADVVQRSLPQSGVERLMIEGGDSASAIVRRCGWTRLETCDEPSAGVVAVRCRSARRPLVIVKPGSYSWPRQVWDALGRERIKSTGQRMMSRVMSAAITATVLLFAAAVFLPTTAAARDFDRVVSVLQTQCLDCHSTAAQEGGVDLERLVDQSFGQRDRAAWKAVYDVIEAGQMPLRDSGYELSDDQRQTMLDWIAWLQAQPDPDLGVIDPGKPVLRRLTRLEYSNTVRDLFGLKMDIFMFPERLPVANKDYFVRSGNDLGRMVQTRMREYGQRYDVLLPQSGLPGDNRAEHGFSNRGDALNTSPLLLEKYLQLANEIAYSDRLLQESQIFADLLGVPRPARKGPQPDGQGAVAAVQQFASNDNVQRQAAENSAGLAAFRESVATAVEQGRGGVYDVPTAHGNQTVAGKGGLIRIKLGTSGKQLTVNPNADLWLVSFATAEETSGEHLLTNRTKGDKKFELTLEVRGGDADEGVQQLGVCVLARRGQRGSVTLTARLSNGRELERTVAIEDDGQNVFFAFDAPAGIAIKRLDVDGSQFSGDYVLLDDLAVITDGQPIENAEVEEQEITDSSPSEERAADGDAAPELQPPAERLRGFLRRAFRRDVSDAEAEEYWAIVQRAMQQGSSQADALRQAVQAALASPSFLFIAQPHRPREGAVRALDDYELASRLSYFLWSSMPDDELLDVARQGQLSDPQVLRQQVERMLEARGRSRELSESFAVQWLRLDQLYTAKPDRRMFPDFYAGPQGKNTMHSAMMIEPLLLFETVMAENRSVLELIDADYTWLDAELAELYGLTDVFQQQVEAVAAAMDPGEPVPDGKQLGGRWYRCPLPDRTRGGVMTMGGPLVVTSLPFRTSPIKRGAWLLETIFNRPPAEPKVAFVLDDKPADEEDLQGLTIRQRFEKHRSDPNCYSCHSRIDPPGFSLEPFDAIGAWRTHEGAQPVDASGQWNGRAFDGPAGFKDALRLREEEFVRGFVEHLLSYALGRELEHFDMPAVAQVLESTADEDYRFSAIIREIATSHPFQFIRQDSSEEPSGEGTRETL